MGSAPALLKGPWQMRQSAKGAAAYVEMALFLICQMRLIYPLEYRGPCTCVS